MFWQFMCRNRGFHETQRVMYSSLRLCYLYYKLFNVYCLQFRWELSMAVHITGNTFMRKEHRVNGQLTGGPNSLPVLSIEVSQWSQLLETIGKSDAKMQKLFTHFSLETERNDRRDRAREQWMSCRFQSIAGYVIRQEICWALALFRPISQPFAVRSQKLWMNGITEMFYLLCCMSSTLGSSQTHLLFMQSFSLNIQFVWPFHLCYRSVHLVPKSLRMIFLTSDCTQSLTQTFIFWSVNSTPDSRLTKTLSKCFDTWVSQIFKKSLKIVPTKVWINEVKGGELTLHMGNTTKLFTLSPNFCC